MKIQKKHIDTLKNVAKVTFNVLSDIIVAIEENKREAKKKTTVIVINN